jgi:hypothetical protein
LPVPLSAVWRPVDEPVGEWYADVGRRRRQTLRNRRSLEAFVGRNLTQLSRMVRTGWWILDRVRMKVEEFRSVPPGPDDMVSTATRPARAAAARSK